MPQHATAPARELEVKTTPPVVRVGAIPAEFGKPRPDLAGLRIKSPADTAIYLVDPEGYRRWIPDPSTYNSLFVDWNGIVIDIDVAEIPLAPSITVGAVLARPAGMAPVYLVSNGVKRWVTLPTVMDKYHFAWNHVVNVPHVLLDFIPTGPNWS
jgi:hypothetical protein